MKFFDLLKYSPEWTKGFCEWQLFCASIRKIEIFYFVSKYTQSGRRDPRPFTVNESKFCGSTYKHDIAKGRVFSTKNLESTYPLKNKINHLLFYHLLFVKCF